MLTDQLVRKLHIVLDRFLFSLFTRYPKKVRVPKICSPKRTSPTYFQQQQMTERDYSWKRLEGLLLRDLTLATTSSSANVIAFKTNCFRNQRNEFHRRLRRLKKRFLRILGPRYFSYVLSNLWSVVRSPTSESKLKFTGTCITAVRGIKYGNSFCIV